MSWVSLWPWNHGGVEGNVWNELEDYEAMPEQMAYNWVAEHVAKRANEPDLVRLVRMASTQ